AAGARPAAGLVHQPAGDQNLSVLAGLRRVGQRRPAAARPALGAVLDDPVVLPGGLGGDLALVNVVADRLLDVHCLAGLARPAGHERVPVVRRRDRDGVEVLVLQGGADVLDRLRFGLIPALLESLGVGAGVGIDQVDQLGVLGLQPFVDVVTAAAVDA